MVSNQMCIHHIFYKQLINGEIYEIKKMSKKTILFVCSNILFFTSFDVTIVQRNKDTSISDFYSILDAIENIICVYKFSFMCIADYRRNDSESLVTL